MKVFLSEYKSKGLILAFCINLLIAVFPFTTHAQGDSVYFNLPKYEVNVGLSYPNGFKIGSRALFTQHFSLEASIGTLLSGFTLCGGINYHANILHETKNPTWSLLFTYVREISGVNRWYVLTGNIGLLQLQKDAFHLYARGGASLWFKKPGYVGGAVRVVPLPSIELGMGWGFP